MRPTELQQTQRETNMNSVAFFSRDAQLKSMEQTVGHAEKHLGQLCSLLGSYTRKTAKVRDKADQLVAQLAEFSNTEDPEASLALKILAEDLAMVQDYRHAQVERLDANVVTPLKAYRDVVKSKRAELKKFSADRTRELKELQKLEKIRQQNPADRQSIAEVSVQKATNNAQRSTRQMEETITDFQRQKLEDVKRIFREFITVEMIFHCKALEVYGAMFQNLEVMDVDKDMEMFSRRIRTSESLPGRPDTLLTSHSTSSMDHHASPTAASTRRLSLSPTLASARGHSFRPTWDHSLRSTLASARGHSKHPEASSRSRTSTLQRQSEVDEEEEEEEEDEDEDEEVCESELEEAQYPARQSYSAQYVQKQRHQK